MFHQIEASVAPGNTIYEAIWLQSIVNGTMTKPSVFSITKKERKRKRNTERKYKKRNNRLREKRRNNAFRGRIQRGGGSRNRAWQIHTEGIEKKVGSVLGSFLCVRASGRFVDPRLQFLLLLLCRLNWPAKVVDAPETARSCCTILSFFLFRRLYR